MDVKYAIVKVYVTECNDVIKRHSNVLTVWQMSAIKATALLKIKKNLHSEMKSVHEKECIVGVRGR